MLVVNEGNEPTFYSARWGTWTHTDLILASPGVDDFLSGFVDHASLEVRLHLGINPTAESKLDLESMEPSNWKDYMEEMELKSGFELGGDEALLWEQYSSLNWTYDIMSDEQKSLRNDMTETIENNCKKSLIKPIAISNK